MRKEYFSIVSQTTDNCHRWAAGLCGGMASRKKSYQAFMYYFKPNPASDALSHPKGAQFSLGKPITALYSLANSSS